MADKEYFCNRSLKPWIIMLVAFTVLLIVWMTVEKETIMLARREDATAAPRNITPPGEPVFPKPLQTAALTNPYSSRDVNLAAITKATPNGGVQLVATPSHSGFQDSLKDAVNSVIPTVCDIHAMWLRRTVVSPRPADMDKLRFLPPFDGNIDKFIQNKGYENIGAGILVEEKGYVLTNYHVVQDAKNIIVTVPGNPSQDYSASTVACDIRRDLALLKIKTREETFPEARLGDSSFCQIGDFVISIGSPFGMEQTVTCGIISGIRKSVKLEGIKYSNLFQTDAPINRGSSGGPLVNLNGEVIGINTAIYAPTGVFNGTGFAIPINDAKQFLTSSLNRSYPVALDRRGMFTNTANVMSGPQDNPLPVRFGIEVTSLHPLVARQLGVWVEHGVLVNRVFVDSPASFAGIQRGDVITSIAGVRVEMVDDIPDIVSHFRTGDNVNMCFIRGGRSSEVLVRLR